MILPLLNPKTFNTLFKCIAFILAFQFCHVQLKLVLGFCDINFIKLLHFESIQE